MGDDFGKALIALFVFGIAIGLVAAIGIPWIWDVLKPWIHSVTA
jgi:hypothetical protein